MGMRVSLAFFFFFFFFSVRGARRKTTKDVRTSARPNLQKKSGPHFSFFLRCEPGTDAEPSLQKMWKVDRTFLFFCGVNLEQMLSPAYRKCEKWTALFIFSAVWTWNRCWAQLTENVKSGPHFSFFSAVWTWNRCWAQLTENVKSGPHFFFFAVWTWNRCWAQLTENVKSGPHFSFLRCEPGTDAEPSLQKMWKVDRTFLFCGVNLEQMLSPAYRKCEKWTALFFFFFAVWTWNRCWAQLTENVKSGPHFSFLRCEPGTDAEPSLQKMWKVDRTFFFFAVWTWNRCWAQLTENVKSGPHFSFFLRCEPGTDAEPSLQKMWKVDRTFLFFCGVNLEQMLSPAYRKCEKWTALFFFCGVNLELMLSPAYRKCEKWTALFFFAVWTWNRCWAQLTENVKSGPHFSFFAVWTWNRCWAQLTENVKSGPHFFFFFCGVNLEQMLSPAYRKCEKWTALFFFCGVNLELMLSPAYRKCEKWTALFFFAVWTWNRCWAQLTENVKSGPHFSFFFCGVNLEQMLSPAYRKCEKWTALFFFFAVWTWNRCWAQLTENVKSGPHFFLRCEPGTDAEPSLQKMWKVDRTFLFLRCEPGTDAEPSLQKMWKVDRTFLFFLRCEPGTDAEPSLQKMWKVDRTFLFCGVNLELMLSPAYRKCEKWTALFFFCGVNLEQMLSPAYRKCEKWTALFFFFLRCEPGTDAEPSLQKMWKVDRTFLFFCGVNLEQMLSPAYRKCEKWTALFFLRCEPGTDAEPSLQKMWKVDRTFLFFCGVNLEQMLSPAYRKCEKWTALFFFAVWTWNRCWAQLTENVKSGPHFSFFFFAVWTWNWCWAQLTENVKSGPHFFFFAVWTWNRCWAQLTENVKSGPHFSFFAVWTWNRCWAQLTENVKSGPHFSFFCGVNLEQMLSPAYRKCEKWTALFFFFAVWTWNRCWAQVTENVKSGSHFSFFFRCEPGTGASLLKMWRKNPTFLRSEPGTGAGRVDRNCGERDRDCWLQSIDENEGFGGLFFALFHIFFHLFSHYVPFFFTFFPFLFSHSFSHFRWPRRGRSLAALPCLPLPYLTLPLLSSLSFRNTILKKKEHRDFQQISVLRSSCPPQRLIISRSIHMSSCRRWIQIVIPNVSCLWDVCVVKARS